MVGANTVINDNPRLSARGSGGKGGITRIQPLRVIVDGKGRVPSSATIFGEPGKTMVVVAKTHDSKKKDELVKSGAEVIELNGDKDSVISLKEIFEILGEKQITSVLVEGGNKLFGYLFDGKLADKVLAFVSPVIIGGEHAKTAVGGSGFGKVAEAVHLSNVKIKNFGNDVLVSGYLNTR
jgi:diaminohydroxyphosphoribosylaminopyrimidine deaminase/5-amino-6-(5-phosphoribosylamino)uracil reductase